MNLLRREPPSLPVLRSTTATRRILLRHTRRTAASRLPWALTYPFHCWAVILPWVRGRRVGGTSHHTTRVGREGVQPFLPFSPSRSWVHLAWSSSDQRVCCTSCVRDDRALGSVRQYPMGESLPGIPGPQRCDEEWAVLRRVTPSLMLGMDERSDATRVSPYIPL